MKTINIMLDEGAFLPTRAHEDDAGIDLYSTKDGCIYPHDSLIIDTGVHVEIPKGYAGFLKSKSGLNVKEGITSEGLIDSGYTGSIVVKLYNNADVRRYVKKGQKISQLVIIPVKTPQLNIVKEFKETDRGANGFGSTGK